MTVTTIVVGSLEGLRAVLGETALAALAPGADVVIVPTAAAFTGIAEAAIAVSEAFTDYDVKVEALMIGDRDACDEPYFVQRLNEADLVILTEGSPLHAKSVWRDTPVGEAIRAAALLVAVGSCASVLGETMIDPRGGAPTTGLGYRSGLVVAVGASEETLARTRSLLGADETLVVLGPRGVVYSSDDTWHRHGDDLVVSRGESLVEL